MGQAELASIVSELKSDFSAPSNMDVKSVGDRANSANLAALDFLVDCCEDVDPAATMVSHAQTLRMLSREFQEISKVVGDLGAPSKK
ncbi:MAG: hypothetical protein COB93_05060 [Sneathiella sp.]|nr:MAG: hypothetical protein COB93_05060 [Sneathiella sp.]